MEIDLWNHPWLYKGKSKQGGGGGGGGGFEMFKMNACVQTQDLACAQTLDQGV